MPCPEALILTSDLFSDEETSDLLYYANRINDISVEYSKRHQDIDTAIIYAQSKKEKNVRTQRQQNRKKSTHKQVLEAELDMHAL